MLEKKEKELQIKKLQLSKKQLKKEKLELKKLKADDQNQKTNSFQSFFSFLQSLFQSRQKDNSAQSTIPYEMIYRDGICKMDEKRYSKTIQFFDITYQLAKPEDKQAIFESWCNFLNYFDSTISFQLSFYNQSIDVNEYQQSIIIPRQNDGFDEIRQEYEAMLKEQLSKGNNGIEKTKYITFTIEAESLKVAKPRLERIETNVLNNFKQLGVKAKSLTGLERLALLYRCFHENDSTKFQFEWDRIAETGMSTKDFISPDSFAFLPTGKAFKIGDIWGTVSFLQILASDLTDEVLTKFLNLEGNILINLHVQPIDQLEAIKYVKRKIMEIDAMAIEEQKKAVRSGYDFDNIPNNIKIDGVEAKELLEDLQNRNERMFLVTVLIMNTAKTRQKLDNYVLQISGIAQQYNCALCRLQYQQEQGLQSSLPIGRNEIEIQRTLTTSSTAVFVPFTTEELFQPKSIYYGINAVSNNLIMADRKLLTNPNGLYNQGRKCDRENNLSFSKKDFRKPMLKFPYMRGDNVS